MKENYDVIVVGAGPAGVDPKVVGVEVISDAILGKGLKEAAAYTYENTEKVLKEVWPELVD